MAMTDAHPDYGRLFDLADRVALVVGAGSGIGQAAAIALAAFGALVIASDLHLEAAKQTVGTILDRGGRAESIEVDVRQTTSVEDLVGQTLHRHGRIDILLAMPAINIRKRLADYSDEEFDQVIELNLKGSFRLARAVSKPMMAQRSGSIVLMSSMRGTTVEPGQSIYGSTKAAISLMVKGLASELADFGVRVNALAPSIVATPINRVIRENPEWNEALRSRTALNRWAAASEMAGPIVFLASDASSYVTGTTLIADGGWTAIDGRYRPPI
ncbi:MAG: SDR family NAD(P)-dependent oxidoreductase [Burkholderiaceae bacterium]|jgi:NAD(P)-dependent dehydrogenase (short-subunit alcohol dehydrogenase family)